MVRDRSLTTDGCLFEWGSGQGGGSKYSLTRKLGDHFIVRDAHLQGHFELASLALQWPVLTSSPFYKRHRKAPLGRPSFWLFHENDVDQTDTSDMFGI